jgi:protein phosphatase
VGDSRAYLVRGQQIWRLTKDHSVVQQLIDLGALTPEQAALHPEANKITRALGMKSETDVEVRDPAVACEAGDVIVLATDGLSDLVRTEEIAGIVSRPTRLDAAGDELVRLANARGGHDNITVQLARVVSTTAPSQEIVPHAAPALTLIDPKTGVAPEKTVVDPAPKMIATAPPTTVPLGVPVPAPGRPTPLMPPNFAPPPAAPVSYPIPAVDTAPPTQTHPGAPSRSGFLVLALGFALVGVILAGVVLWWILRGPR